MHVKSLLQLCVKLTIVLLLSSPINLLAATTAATIAPSPIGSIFKILLGLTVVLLVMAAITWVLKRMMPGAGGQHSVIKVVGGVSVGTRERVVVVEVAGRWLVVGVAAGQVNAIANLDKDSNMPVSVSYTHLDVYKRQPPYSAQQAAGATHLLNQHKQPIEKHTRSDGLKQDKDKIQAAEATEEMMQLALLSVPVEEKGQAQDKIATNSNIESVNNQQNEQVTASVLAVMNPVETVNRQNSGADVEIGIEQVKVDSSACLLYTSRCV